MANTRKGKGSKKPRSTSTTKRPSRPAGDPITVGGGGGRRLKRRIARVNDSFIKFKRGAGHYLKKGSHRYESDNYVLLGIDISCAEDTPATGPDSNIQIDFSDSRVPASNARVSIIITGNPLGITFKGDWIDKGDPLFHCAYLMVREVYVGNKRVARSATGDCEITVYNKDVRRAPRR